MQLPELDRSEVEQICRHALHEDLGDAGDITTKRIVRIDQPARARILARSAGVIAGVPIADTVFRIVDKGLAIDWKVSDGAVVEEDAIIAEIAGRARAILAAERVAINFLQQLSGVATLTRRFADVCAEHGVRLLCTRKTVPGLRAFQRYSVAVGGGGLHRAGLFDEILIKTNHTRLSGGITEAVRRTKANPNLQAAVEAQTMAEVREAIAAGADKILLDNASPKVIGEAVAFTRGRPPLEVTGGVTLENIDEIAKLKPDAISVGRLTHSAPALDLALEVFGPTGAAPR